MVLAACADFVTPRSGPHTLDDRGVADGFIAVSVGLVHTCALTTDGSAFCWGSNEFGQLGVLADTTCARDDRRIPCVLKPKAVDGGLKFQKIAAGASHTCALGTDSRIYCWGDNLRGQLGDPGIRQAGTPAPVASAALFTDVAAGDAHTCALRTDGVLLCWGANAVGQLGVATVGTGSAVPVAVQSSLRFASVATGARRSCARVPDGTAYCWGSMWVSRAFDGTEVTRAQPQPARVLPLSLAFQSVTVGGQTTCGISMDNVAHCWEANPTGAMGDGSKVGNTAPQRVNSTEKFIAVSAGLSGTCGIADSGLAFCWGSDASGQLGVSPSGISRRCGTTSVPCYLSPIRISGWRTFTRISAGLGDHACGLTMAGNVYCWGAGSLGQRGDGRTRAEWSPTKTAPPL